MSYRIQRYPSEAFTPEITRGVAPSNASFPSGQSIVLTLPFALFSHFFMLDTAEFQTSTMDKEREREKERPGGPSNKVIDRTRLSFWIHFFQRIVRELRLSSKRSNLAQALLLSRSIKLSPFTLCFFFSLLFIYQWVIYFQGIQGFKHFSYIGFTLLSSRCGGSVISFYVSYDLGTFCIEKVFVSYKRPRILILLSRDGYHVEKFRRNLFARVNKQNEKCSSNEFSDKLVNRSCRRSILLLSS